LGGYLDAATLRGFLSQRFFILLNIFLSDGFFADNSEIISDESNVGSQRLSGRLAGPLLKDFLLREMKIN